MNFTVLTLFPELFEPFFYHGMIRQGIDKGLINGETVNIRDFTFDRHHTVDDRPYGGGSGMVMKPEPLKAAVNEAKKVSPDARVILMTPQGHPFSQPKAVEMASNGQNLIFICGRYEGIDERVFTTLVDEEISIGDYVMTGGELAAMVIIDAVARLVPGVLGCSQSSQADSFTDDRLEYAQFTRPEVFGDLRVPDTLLSGNHEKIRQWRKLSSLQRTFLKRPDLFMKNRLNPEEKEIIRQWCQELSSLVRE